MIKFSSPYFRIIYCIFCASFLLVGCSYFDTDESLSASSGDIEQVGLMSQSAYQMPTLSEVVARSTKGQVQVFPLNEPLPQSQATYSVPGGLPSSIQKEPMTQVDLNQAQGAVSDDTALLGLAKSPFASVPAREEPPRGVQVFSLQ